MKLSLGLIAEFASALKDNKLMIAGEYDTIFASSVPTILRRFFVVVRVDAHEEPHKTHSIILGLREPGGRGIPPRLEAIVPFEQAARDDTARAQVIFEIVARQLGQFGLYEFRVEVDGHEVGTIPLRVRMGHPSHR